MKLPHEFHPDLTEERIAAIARLIADAYWETLSHRIEEKGDSRWAHGCRRYDWARQRIRDAAGTAAAPYLKILKDRGSAFLFLIGEVPVKYKRTDTDDPAEGTATQSLLEAQQLSLLEFYGLQDPGELSWRFLLEDNFDGELIRAVFVGIDAATNEVRCFWEIPYEKISAPPVIIDGVRDEGVELPPARVTLKTDADQDDAEENIDADKADKGKA